MVLWKKKKKLFILLVFSWVILDAFKTQKFTNWKGPSVFNWKFTTSSKVRCAADNEYYNSDTVAYVQKKIYTQTFIKELLTKTKTKTEHKQKATVFVFTEFQQISRT